MLIRNIEKNEDNSLEIKNFWKETLEIFPIKILNSNKTSIKYMGGQNFSLRVPFDLEYSIMEAGNIHIMIGTRTPV